MRDNCHLADVVYTRWRTPGGKFPYSPYNRVTHLNGSNFVGTDVCLSPEAAFMFVQCAEKNGDDVDTTLRELALAGLTFHAVNVVTYERSCNGAA